MKLVVTHPEYAAETVLDAAQHAELAADLAAPGATGGSRSPAPPEPMQLSPFRRLDPDLPLPARQHADDAGYDLVARRRRTFRSGGGRAIIPDRASWIAIPPGYAGFVQPRRGVACSGITV